MAQGRADSLWDHTAEVLSLLANCHRDRKTYPKPFTATQFRPRRAGDKPRKETPLPAGIDALRVFLPASQRGKGKPSCEPPSPAPPSSP